MQKLEEDCLEVTGISRRRRPKTTQIETFGKDLKVLNLIDKNASARTDRKRKFTQLISISQLIGTKA